MEDNFKFVAFEKYCPKCKNQEKSSTHEPCNTCLETGARIGTEVPEEFVERKNDK